MKRVIRKDKEQLAEVMGKLYTTMFDWLTGEDGGYDESEADDLFNLETETDEYGDTIIRLNAEISYEGFMDIAPELNKIVETIDPEAYFDAETSGRYICILNTGNHPEREVGRFKESKFENACVDAGNKVMKEVGDVKLEDSFTLGAADVDENLEDGIARCYYEIQGRKYESGAYIDIDVSDLVSATELRYEVSDAMYSALMENLATRG